MIRPKKPWFPAKTYGWGWGFPTTWQGVTVLLVWIVAFGLGLILLLESDSEVLQMLALPYGILTSALLIAICWLTGERPRWRWGKKDEAGPASHPEDTEP